jgi:hypothetical protein
LDWNRLRDTDDAFTIGNIPQQYGAMMTLTHWEYRALVAAQLGLIERILQACPNEVAMKDLLSALSRLQELVAAYIEAPKG